MNFKLSLSFIHPTLFVRKRQERKISFKTLSHDMCCIMRSIDPSSSSSFLLLGSSYCTVILRHLLLIPNRMVIKLFTSPHDMYQRQGTQVSLAVSSANFKSKKSFIHSLVPFTTNVIRGIDMREKMQKTNRNRERERKRKRKKEQEMKSLILINFFLESERRENQ